MLPRGRHCQQLKLPPPPSAVGLVIVVKPCLAGTSLYWPVFRLRLVCRWRAQHSFPVGRKRARHSHIDCGRRNKYAGTGRAVGRSFQERSGFVRRKHHRLKPIQYRRRSWRVGNRPANSHCKPFIVCFRHDMAFRRFHCLVSHHDSIVERENQPMGRRFAYPCFHNLHGCPFQITKAQRSGNMAGKLLGKLKEKAGGGHE